MITFMSVFFALLYSGLYMASVGISLKVERKAMILGEVDEHSLYYCYLQGPFELVFDLTKDVCTYMFVGIWCLLSEDFRENLISKETLTEEDQ